MFMPMNYNIPDTQHAVQLIGPDKLRLNTAKPVFHPGPHQILCQVEAVGLCFSDLKLLKQFSSHVRKAAITSGIDTEILKEIPSYVCGDAPTVPGHEAAVRICAIGEKVKNFKPGERYLVQADYRWLLTSHSNAAFGYNFEGALQEYTLMDERVITSPEGDSMLISASRKLSASAIALVEPWACVEDSYAVRERRVEKVGGKQLVVREKEARDIAKLKDASYDDIVYFGSSCETVEALFPKLANHGLFNIVLCGGRLGRPIVCPVGRVHYSGIRIVGTTGSFPNKSMENIPASGEIRKGDKINVIGAGGPMGVMHVVRNICQGVLDISVFAGDLNTERLKALTRISAHLAKKNRVSFHPYNPSKDRLKEKFDYVVLMAPIPELVTQSLRDAAPHAIINIFAGIPVSATCHIDLDTYIEKEVYFIGTSGSVPEDMKVVLEKVEAGKIDTNLSVGAVSGLRGAIEGIRAVEKNLISGKIIVYPSCKGLGLAPISSFVNGAWNEEAEKKLLKQGEI